MKALVAIKRTIDPDLKVKLKAGGEWDTTGVEYKLNPFCEIAVEEALRLREKGVIKEIVIVTVGGDESQKEIRHALAMGADRGILVKADSAELDTLVVAKALKAIVDKESPDLILLGKLSVDSENNQVGQMLAELTGFGQGTFAYKVEASGDSILVGREVDGGTVDVKLKLPAIVTTDLRLNEPRYAPLPGIMAAKKKPLEVLEIDSLDIDAERKVRTIGYELPPARAAGEIVADVDALIHKLKTVAKAI